MPKLPEIQLAEITNKSTVILSTDLYRFRVGALERSFGIVDAVPTHVTEAMVGKLAGDFPTTLQLLREVGPKRFRYVVEVLKNARDFAIWTGRRCCSDQTVFVAYGDTAEEAHAAWCKLYQVKACGGASDVFCLKTRSLLVDHVRYLIKGDCRSLRNHTFGNDGILSAKPSNQGCFDFTQESYNHKLRISMAAVQVKSASRRS